MAEIRWPLKVIQTNYFQRYCNDISDLFSAIFPGHEILERYFFRIAKCR